MEPLNPPSIKAASNAAGQTISPPRNVFQLFLPLYIDWKTSMAPESSGALRLSILLALDNLGEGVEEALR